MYAMVGEMWCVRDPGIHILRQSMGPQSHTVKAPCFVGFFFSFVFLHDEDRFSAIVRSTQKNAPLSEP